MAKITKRQLREKVQKNDLRRRVADIAAGATSGNASQDDDYCFDPDDLSRIVPAIRRSLIGFDEDGDEILGYLTAPHNLDNYCTVDSITEFLFSQGVRA